MAACAWSEGMNSPMTPVALNISSAASHALDAADVPLERDGFTRRLIRELAGTLQDVVGIEEAAGYISVVGTAMGEHIDETYRKALTVDRLSREQVRDVLVDLKRRIQGDFFVIEEAEDRIVLGNRACPFAEMVVGRPSLCMMTSNVFGHIAAENLGYAAVELERTIARGDPGCRVVVHLRPGPDVPPAAREYFQR
jgi:predicted ArsR family transcriptional regulator